MPVRHFHDVDDLFDIRVGNSRLEEIAHRINEDRFLRRPFQRLGEFFGYQSQVETPFVGVARNTAESFGEGLSVTVLAAWTDLGAAADRIPRRVGPFD